MSKAAPSVGPTNNASEPEEAIRLTAGCKRRDTRFCGGGCHLRFHRLDVLRRFPHPGRAFIQGLVLAGETVWESTGLYGESSLRRYQLGAEQPQKHVPLLPQLFGEGICCVGGSIWQLTWRERIALRWDAATMKLSEMVPFDRDGWGICSSGGYVLTSDGSSELVLRNPGTLQPLSSMPVHCNGYPVSEINDLAYVAGRIWANLYCRHYVIGIDSHTGEITDIVDARAVMERPSGDNTQAVLNGIATFPNAGELLLSGKGWQYIYHVRLVEGCPSKQPEKLIVDLLYNYRSSSSELEIALAQILHPRPVGITGIPIRTRLKRSRPGAIVDTTEISDSGGVSSQA